MRNSNGHDSLLRVVSSLLAMLLLSASVAAELPHVPDGFSVEVVAEAPLVSRPTMGCFDDRGRLFVCESAGTNRPADELVEEPLDHIAMLEDTDGDGVFDKVTTFADKLTFPQGCLWHQGALYTCSPPYLWKLEDTDDDGVCDKRTVIVGKFGFIGNAADIHGPFLGPDGRIYWCDGRHGHEFFDEQGNITSKGRAARIFSCNPDGSDPRAICGGGMDNPVEIDWLETGEMVGTVNLFYGRPRGDCLVHWIEGGVYPRYDQEDCIAEFTWTGGLLPEIHNYGHVAVSGMCRIRSSQFLDDVPQSPRVTPRGSTTGRPQFFVTQFNTHKVVKTTIEREGSTFRHVDTRDFVVWDDPDVHPTDVLEDADGSLLVIDTGGWFRKGCPTSQIAKPEILGSIYRVRRDESVGRTPQRRSTTRSIPPGPNELALILSMGPAPQRLAAAQQLARAFSDSQMAVPEDVKKPFVTGVVRALEADVPDAHLTHALILALIRMNAAELTRPCLQHDLPGVRRAALIALDQMPSGDLQQQEVVSLLETPDADLQQAALEVIRRREGWADAVVDNVRTWLTAGDIPAERAGAVRELLVAEAGSENIQRMIADGLLGEKLPVSSRLVLLEAIDAAQPGDWPPEWTRAMEASLEHPEESVRLRSLAIIGRRELEAFDGRLKRTARDPSRSTEERVEAFAAAAPRLSKTSEELFRFLIGRLVGEADLLDRLTIARGLANAPLSDAQLSALAGSFKQIGPETVPILLPAFQKSESDEVGRNLVASLSVLGNSLSISPTELTRLLERYSESVRQQAKPLLAELGTDLEEQRERLYELLAVIDAEEGHAHADRGRDVFFGKKAACSSCHRIGNEGAEIGPDLTRIGAIRQPRDLLEAIAFPSASFARDYRPYTVLTEQGRVYTGLIQRRTEDSLILRLADLTTVRIPGSSIELFRESDTSIMPKGLDTKLTPDELRDLVAYLQSRR